MLGAQVDLLAVGAAAHIPEMQDVAVFLGDDVLQAGAVLKHFGGAPFAGDHGVNADVPPEIVGQFLGAAVQFPGADGFKGVVVQQHNAAGPVALGGAQGTDIDGVRPAVDGMGAGVAGALHLFGLNGFDDAGPRGVGLGVQDVDAAAGEGRHHQVAPFQMGMRGGGAEGGATGVPAEVVQLVVQMGHRGFVNHLGVGRRIGVAVHHGHGVGPAGAGVEDGHVGQPLLGGGHRQPGRGVKGGVGAPEGHDINSCGGVGNVWFGGGFRPPDAGALCALFMTTPS